MTQYEIENAKNAIEGYRTPRAHETPESAFLRAQAEAAMNYRKMAENVEAITLTQFTYRPNTHVLP